MKRKKIFLATLVAALFISAGILYASDHIDTPAVTNQPYDITDLYVFKGANANNLVFVGNTQGLLSPAATAAAKFDENTVIQFNIDNNGDNIQDLVLQAKYDAASNTMVFYGPVKPSSTGIVSKLEGTPTAIVPITPYNAAPISATGSNGIQVFAGPRDDPFFFDLSQYKAILAGTASSFNNPGHDSFAGTNVLGLVVEVPKSLLGNSSTINVWLEAKKKM